MITIFQIETKLYTFISNFSDTKSLDYFNLSEFMEYMYMAHEVMAVFRLTLNYIVLKGKKLFYI